MKCGTGWNHFLEINGNRIELIELKGSQPLYYAAYLCGAYSTLGFSLRGTDLIYHISGMHDIAPHLISSKFLGAEMPTLHWTEVFVKPLGLTHDNFGGHGIYIFLMLFCKDLCKEIDTSRLTTSTASH